MWARKRRSGATREKPLARLLRLIIVNSRPLFLILSIAGLFGPFLVPLAERQIRADEKALLIGAAHANVRSNSGSSIAGLELAAAAHQLQNRALDAIPNSSSLADLVVSHLMHHGIEAYTSNACSHSDGALSEAPLSTAGNVSDYATSQAASPSGACISVHAIVRSKLGDGKESLVVATPMQLTPGPCSVPPCSTGSGGELLVLSAALTLLHHLRGATWLAKDLVWLLPDTRCLGSLGALELWLQAYQAAPQTALGPDAAPWQQRAPDSPPAPPGPKSCSRAHSQALFGRAGLMQQAVVVEADSPAPEEVLVEAVGWDGLLPKLDTLHLLQSNSLVLQGVGLGGAQLAPGVKPWLDWVGRQGAAPELLAHLHKLGVLLQWAQRQAQGQPRGPHAAFKHFMVDAATVRLTGPQVRARGDPLHPQLPARAVQLAEFMELCLRSLNNLDERFHHSYFLYALTSLTGFVTVEHYILPLVLLIAALLMKAAGMYHDLSSSQAGSPLQLKDAHAGSTHPSPGPSPGPGCERTPEATPAPGTTSVSPPTLHIPTAVDAEQTASLQPPPPQPAWLNAACEALAMLGTCTALGMVMVGCSCERRWLAGRAGLLGQLLLPAKALIPPSVQAAVVGVVTVLLTTAAWLGWQSVRHSTRHSGTPRDGFSRQRVMQAKASHAMVLGWVALLLSAVASLNWALAHVCAASAMCMELLTRWATQPAERLQPPQPHQSQQSGRRVEDGQPMRRSMRVLATGSSMVRTCLTCLSLANVLVLAVAVLVDTAPGDSSVRARVSHITTFACQARPLTRLLLWSGLLPLMLSLVSLLLCN